MIRLAVSLTALVILTGCGNSIGEEDVKPIVVKLEDGREINCITVNQSGSWGSIECEFAAR